MTESVTPDAPPLLWPRVLRQRWSNLTFVHWAVDPAAVAHLYPRGTRPDEFDGRSFVGLVPFQMSLYGRFLETNIRLYSVDGTGRRGVFFLSLDAERLDVVLAARSLVGVPYRWARMTYERDGDRVSYTSTLRWRGVTASSAVDVTIGDRLACGPLEHFLTARWGAHVVRGRRTWYVPNEHARWELRRAHATRIEADGLFESVGLEDLSVRPPDHVAFTDGVGARFGRPGPATRPRVVHVG